MNLPISLLLALALTAPVASSESLAPETRPSEPEFFAAPSLENDRCWILRTKLAVYSLEVPPGFSASWQPGSRTIALRGAAGAISLHFEDKNTGRDSDDRVWRKQVLERYPGAAVMDSPELSALNQPAAAIDIQWHQGEIVRAGRFARIPIPSGFIELSFMGTQETFGDGLPGLSQLMLSLRSSAPGARVDFKARLRE